MLKRTLTLLTSALALSIGLGIAADPPAAPVKEQVYGSQLMTRAERAEHRAKLRAARTTEERAQIRAEHHERMLQRARELGVTLPDTPPAVGGGMGPGPGPGLGMGPGGGGRGR